MYMVASLYAVDLSLFLASLRREMTTLKQQQQQNNNNNNKRQIENCSSQICGNRSKRKVCLTVIFSPSTSNVFWQLSEIIVGWDSLIKVSSRSRNNNEVFPTPGSPRSTILNCGYLSSWISLVILHVRACCKCAWILHVRACCKWADMQYHPVCIEFRIFAEWFE